jgi:uncharacterized protein involved in propanediol utilization
VASGKASGSSPQSGARSPARPLEVGYGTAIAHHGEFLQGVFEGADERLHRGLITVPLPSRQAVATFWPRPGPGIRTRPAGRSKAKRAARLALAHLGHPHAGGDLTIESAIPIGHGYGSSTADVIASIRAVAAAAGATLRRSTICKLAVAAEGASDAIAYEDQAVLFAHREGRIIEHMSAEYPPLIIVGFRCASDQPVNTTAMPGARYDRSEVEQFRVLRGLAQHALFNQDPCLLGRVATSSARINQRHLPKSRFETVLRLADTHHACGVQVAHSGSLMGILVDARRPGAAAAANAVATAVRQEGFADLLAFGLGADGASVL